MENVDEVSGGRVFLPGCRNISGGTMHEYVAYAIGTGDHIVTTPPSTREIRGCASLDTFANRRSKTGSVTVSWIG
jgi:hypothetical protein